MLDPQVDIFEAANALCDLAQAYSQAGDELRADQLIRQAADLELTSESIQACWGGPFNGQEGRQRLIREIIDNFRPTCIIETGSFRGLTTKWFAQNFSGPVYSVEVSKRYFYQAVKNNEKMLNAVISNQDSRDYLKNFSGGETGCLRPLIYLDAHWEEDLPLKTEIELISEKFEDCIVVIDDCEVPFDSGYKWDDYGDGLALNGKYISGVSSAMFSLYFPTLPSAEETGQKRGCCVLSKNADAALDLCCSLKKGNWEGWAQTKEKTNSLSVHAPNSEHKIVAIHINSNSYRKLNAQLREDQAEKLRLIEQLIAENEAINIDRNNRLKLIESLSLQLKEVEADRDNRLQLINSLSTQLEEVEADRDDRLKLIERLSVQLREVETDRDDRLQLINSLSTQLEEVEADRNERLKLINCLSAQLKEVKAELIKSLSAKVEEIEQKKEV